MRKQTKKWTCKDGTKIRICDMKDSHLINAIKCLDRVSKNTTDALICDGYVGLSCLQGEMAIESLEDEIFGLEEQGLDPTEINPLYDNLCQECVRRRLNVYET